LEWDGSTQAEIHFVFKLTWDRFIQYKFRFVKSSQAVIVLKTHVEKYFGTTVSKWGYGQLKSRYIM